MKLLVLAVDRDDDLGRKTPLRGPIVGRSAMVEAGKTLAIADPEESDANAIFAAVHEYDDVASDPAAFGAAEAEVALITGDIRVGAKSDGILAGQLERILEQTGADQILLVSDGAEDEHLLPIIASRRSIYGVRRVVIKQAKNIEGFVYLMMRLMQDEKLQRRFFLPLAVLLFAAAASVFFRQPGLFLSAALALVGLLILIQIFGWEEPLERFFSTLAAEAKGGKLSLFASLVSLILVALGGWLTLNSDAVGAAGPWWYYAIVFTEGVFWWLVAAVLVTMAGRGMDVAVRKGRLPGRHVESALFLLSGAFVGWSVLLAITTWLADGTLRTLPLLLLSTYLFFAGFLFFAGLIAVAYYQNLARVSGRPEKALD